jgi:alpha-L-arabinofuranosidase
VRYANIEKEYGIQYWAIGNEPTLFAAALQEEYDTERFNREWREFALAMKAVDENILLVGPELHQFSANAAGNPKDSSGRDWMIEFLKANGDLVDIVSFHRYPFGDARVTATLRICARMLTSGMVRLPTCEN